MSRWIDQFESHPFQSIWAELKHELGNSKVDDQTLATSVAELARLQKVVDYIDSLIKSSDPELIPTSTWNAFQEQAASCLGQVKTYNANRNIGHIKHANNHVDNLLSYVKPYIVAPSNVAKSMQAGLIALSKTISSYGESIESQAIASLSKIKDLEKQSTNALEELKSLKDKAELFDSELFSDTPESPGLKQRTTGNPPIFHRA